MNWEEQLGIKISALVGGLVGGVFALTYEERLSFGRALTLILGGGFTAGYGFSLADHWGLPHNMSGVFGFGIGLVAMRIMDIIVTLFVKASKDPSILLSYVKLLNSLKQDGNSTTNSSGSSDSKPDLDTTGEVNKEHLS